MNIFPGRTFSANNQMLESTMAEVSQQPQPAVHCSRSTGARRFWTAESPLLPVDPRSPCALSSAGVVSCQLQTFAFSLLFCFLTSSPSFGCGFVGRFGPLFCLGFCGGSLVRLWHLQSNFPVRWPDERNYSTRGQTADERRYFL